MIADFVAIHILSLTKASSVNVCFSFFWTLNCSQVVFTHVPNLFEVFCLRLSLTWNNCLSFSLTELLSNFHGWIFFTLPLKPLLQYTIRRREGNLIGEEINHFSIYYVASTVKGALHILFQQELPFSWIFKTLFLRRL